MGTARRLALDAVAPLTIALTSLLLGWPRTATTIQAVDGGEMALTAARGTLAHPPGFPVYTTLLHLVVGPDSANPYAACARVSCVFTACAAALLALLLTRVSSSRLLGGALALCWAILEPTIFTSTDADVFALHHAIIVVLALCCAVLWRGERALLWAALVGALFGLGGATHPIVVLWSPLVLGALASASNRSTSRFLLLALIAGCACAISLSPYLLLEVQWARAPALAFGEVNDLPSVLAHALRESYGSLQAGARDDESVSYLPHFLLAAAPAAPLFLLAPVAAALLWKRSSLALASAVTALAHGLFLWRLRFPPNELVFGEVATRFYPSALVAGALCAGVVLGCSPLSRRWALVIASASLLCAGAALPRALIAADARDDVLLEAYVREVFAEAPPNAIVIASSDGIAFGARYLQAVRGVRPDVAVIVEGRLPSDWAWAQARALVGDVPEATAGPDRLRALFDAAHRQGRTVMGGNDAAAPAGVARRPLGIAWVWLLPDEVPNEQVLTERILAGCARLPDAIGTVDDARTSSALARILWLAPLTNARNAHLSSPAIARALEQVAAGDIVGARATCATGAAASAR